VGTTHHTLSSDTCIAQVEELMILDPGLHGSLTGLSCGRTNRSSQLVCITSTRSCFAWNYVWMPWALSMRVPWAASRLEPYRPPGMLIFQRTASAPVL
jgi:hypothetical protein